MSMAPHPTLAAGSGAPHAPPAEVSTAATLAPVAARETAERLGWLGVRVLSAVSMLMLNRRTRKAAPCPWLTPSRLDAHQALLVDAFTQLHEQVGQTLRTAGMTLVWSPSAGVSALRLATETTQGLLQIARDVLEEVQRQAHRPSPVRLELDLLHGETGSHLRMAIIDTGRATHGTAAPCTGHDSGLSMAQRHATQLGAQLDISTDPSGWCAELVLQLAPA